MEVVSRQLDTTAIDVRVAAQQMARASSASEEFRDVLDASLTQLGRALNRVSVFDGRSPAVPGED
jgi:transcription termination factor Rho